MRQNITKQIFLYASAGFALFALVACLVGIFIFNGPVSFHHVFRVVAGMFIIMMAAGALVFTLMMMVNRWLLQPILRMERDVDHIAREAAIDARLTPSGHPVLVNLAKTINMMLTGLEQTSLLLHESEKRLKKAQSLVRLGNWDAEVCENWGWASTQAFELAGLAPECQMMKLTDMLKCIDRSGRSELFEALRHLMAEECESFQVECRLKVVDSESLWVRIIVNINSPNENRFSMHGTIQDITAEKAHEQKLRESGQFLRGILEAMPDNLIVRNNKLEIIHSNREIKESDASTAPCGLPECGQCRAADVLNSGVPLEFEAQNEEHGLINEVRLFPVFNEQEEVSMIVEHIVDITERKQKEEEFEKIRAAVDDASEGIMTLSLEGEVDYMNLALAEILRHTKDTINEGGLEQIFTRTEDLVNVMRTARNYESWTREVKLINSNGQALPCLVRATPILDEHVETIGVLVIVSDETERRELEHQLFQSQKLRSIGQMAAGIAHEINTPTQYVGDNLMFVGESFDSIKAVLNKYEELLECVRNGDDTSNLISSLEELRDEEDMDYLMNEVPEALRQSQEGMQHVARIVGAMKDFSHPGVEEKTQVNLNRALESTATVARNEWKYVAELEMDLEKELPNVSCLAGEMNQAFLNLIVNAAHAIEERNRIEQREKGKITISTRSTAQAVQVRIIDNGSGIPENVRGQIFDPFFTTKDVGKGTGQGLSIVHSVITQKHDGKLDFESSVGEGTTFIIELPLAVKGPKESA